MKWNFLEFQKIIKSKLCESNIHGRIAQFTAIFSSGVLWEYSSRMSEIHFFSLSWVSWDVPRTKSLELIRLIKCLSFSIEEKSNLTAITYII